MPNPDGLYLIDSWGKVLRQLFADKNGQWTTDCVFSPDGQKIAFIGNHDPNQGCNLYIMNIDGGNLRRLTHWQGHDDYPFFTPDGKRLYFARFYQNVGADQAFRTLYIICDICYVDMETGKVHYVTKNKRFRDMEYMAPLGGGECAFISTWDYGDLGSLFWTVNLRDNQKLCPVVPDLRSVVRAPPPKEKKSFTIEHYHHTDGTVFSVRSFPYGKKEVAYLEMEEPRLSQDGNWRAFAWQPFGKKDYWGNHIDDMLFLTDLRTMKPCG